MSANCVSKPHEIRIAVSHLKPDKGDGDTGLTSDHIVNADEDCSSHTACLL